MNDDSIDVFGRAMLYIYQARLESLGLKGDLIAVRAAKPDRAKIEEAE